MTRTNAKQTACLLAVILTRSKLNRARISAITIKVLGSRTTLRSAFVTEISNELAISYDWILFDLATGGYGAIQAKSLEAAKSVTAKTWLTEKELQNLRRGKMDFDALENEVAPEIDGANDDD